MGCPILSMTSVWATAPPKRGANTSTGAGRIPAALDPITSTTAMTAAIRAVRSTGRRRFAVFPAAEAAAFARVFF